MIYTTKSERSQLYESLNQEHGTGTFGVDGMFSVRVWCNGFFTGAENRNQSRVVGWKRGGFGAWSEWYPCPHNHHWWPTPLCDRPVKRRGIPEGWCAFFFGWLHMGHHAGLFGGSAGDLHRSKPDGKWRSCSDQDWRWRTDLVRSERDRMFSSPTCRFWSNWHQQHSICQLGFFFDGRTGYQ